MSEGNRDEILGIYVYKDEHYRFAIYDQLSEHKLLLEDHHIDFIDEVDQMYVVAKRLNTDKSIKVLATENLVEILTKNVGEDFDANTQIQFIDIIRVCLGEEIKKYFLKRKQGHPTKKENEIMGLINQSRKSEILIKHKIGFGINPFKDSLNINSYKELANQPIIIPPSTSDQLRRCLILVGSKASGNTADMSKEFTALLDELYKSGKITKVMYKALWYKYKNLVEVNDRRNSNKTN